MSNRVGLGYDLHRLEPGRPFVLGGITLEHETGPAGHSDGDVLLHALTDALLGAAALGDIGDRFDDRDIAHKDAESRVFVEAVMKAIGEKGYRVVNVDGNVILQQPRLGPHKAEIRRNVADLLGIDQACVSIKAKTNERVDAVGEGRAIAAQVIVLLEDA